MKKILFWCQTELRNTGGPSGYCYNIYQFLKNNPNPNITFLFDLLKGDSSCISSTKIQRTGIFDDLKKIINYCWRIYHYPKYTIPNYIIDEYDIIHFHTIFELLKFKNCYPCYKGKTILTTHCPSTWTDEVLLRENNKLRFCRNIILNYENKAYETADYIHFPCKEAREPYEKEPKIKKVFAENETKFIYLPSAIFDQDLTDSNIQKYSHFNIPANAFVVTYFGRHNSVKGYDILKKVGQRLLERHQNLYFLCAGKGDIQPLEHDRWLELGFINNTQELLWQSDLYILPNRDTYFDLITLEVMRSKTPIILSNTGGNKYFRNVITSDFEGIQYFDIGDVDNLIEKVETMISFKAAAPSLYKELGDKNRNIFKEYFTIDKFMSAYTAMIAQL